MQLRYDLLAELVAAPARGCPGGLPRLGLRDSGREEGAATWYAFKLSDTTYGIFDTFASEDDKTIAALRTGVAAPPGHHEQPGDHAAGSGPAGSGGGEARFSG